MASIFTYEPDPPRVASPWLRNGGTEGTTSGRGQNSPDASNVADSGNHMLVGEAMQSMHRVHRLEAEPQDGPVEYKLHLLLRPRRKFRSTSTGMNLSGSTHSNLGSNTSSRSISESVVGSEMVSDGSVAPPQASTQQTRQHRLEQLTTQLLWRLQQSSPHHTSSATNTILPSLPEALPELQAPQYPARLLHGLEESRGALYEIGVSDDGTLVGLAEDEMHESLNNLRAMAACLGCTVEVLRQETVGECEWLEDVVIGGKERKFRRTGRLLVVEALVKPHFPPTSVLVPSRNGADYHTTNSQTPESPGISPPTTEQLRITLTGPTTSGKSTLLGTLTMSTLDNGRGQSRLSMLKHRHEINSGMTSSVTQELVGYQDAPDGTVEVVNFAKENVASWIDIHVAASGSRLVLVSDSAGHPRYRRTTVRGLVGCAPHWTLLCIPANDTEDAMTAAGSSQSAHQNSSSTVSDMDLSEAQLELCLRLGLPLVVVMTKLDLASKSGLKSRLTKVLDALKTAGRKPTIVPNASGAVSDHDLQTIGATAIDRAYHVALPLLNNLVETVPIVLTSAVQGFGISNLHALLHELPIPASDAGPAYSAGFVFHIEEIYSKPAEGEGVVVSGLLRSGQISVGDTAALGPFSLHEIDDSEDSDERSTRQSSSQLPTSRSFPGALRNGHLALPQFQLPDQEWRRVRVTSVRNLRLPVHSLFADQVGTVAITLDKSKRAVQSSPGLRRIRKGMVLTAIHPQATRSFTAEFKREDLESLAVGNHVVVYIASVRASAKVISAQAPESPLLIRQENSTYESNGHDPFSFTDNEMSVRDMESEIQTEKVAGMITAPTLLVTLNFDASKEFIVVGDQVLVMPGGGPGLYGGLERGEKGIAGLEGFVGKITETFG